MSILDCVKYLSSRRSTYLKIIALQRITSRGCIRHAFRVAHTTIVAFVDQSPFAKKPTGPMPVHFFLLPTATVTWDKENKGGKKWQKVRSLRVLYCCTVVLVLLYCSTMTDHHRSPPITTDHLRLINSHVALFNEIHGVANFSLLDDGLPRLKFHPMHDIGDFSLLRDGQLCQHGNADQRTGEETSMQWEVVDVVSECGHVVSECG